MIKKFKLFKESLEEHSDGLIEEITLDDFQNAKELANVDPSIEFVKKHFTENFGMLTPLDYPSTKYLSNVEMGSFMLYIYDSWLYISASVNLPYGTPRWDDDQLDDVYYDPETGDEDDDIESVEIYHRIDIGFGVQELLDDYYDIIQDIIEQ